MNVPLPPFSAGAAIAASPALVKDNPLPVLVSRYYSICQALFDSLALVAAWEITLRLRILLNPLFTLPLTETQLIQVAPPLAGLFALWIPAVAWLRLYRRPQVRLGETLLQVAECAVLVGALSVIVTFFSRSMGADLSRSFVLLFVPVSFVMLMTARYAAILTDGYISGKWGVDRIGIVGYDSDAIHFAERLTSAVRTRTAIVGIIRANGCSGAAPDGTHLPVVGSTGTLAEAINTARLNKIVIVGNRIGVSELTSCVDTCNRMGVTATRVIDEPRQNVRLEISDIAGLRLLEFRPVLITRKQEAAKRIFDIMFAATLLIVLAPVMLLTALLIKCTSAGPALYCSTRVGKGGRHFAFFKFRTMYYGSENRVTVKHQNEKHGHLFKIRQDPRVTPLGRYLRRWSIDELPQLFNVLLGSMSMVGPRPLPSADLDPDGQSREFAAWAEVRSRVLPGITGMWQIRGRSDLPFDKMVDLDVAYLRDWSLALDLRILLETPIVLITGRGAY